MLRIGLVDDGTLFRKSLIFTIASFDDMSLALEATNGKELLDALEANPVDVLLLDIQMPVMDGFEAGVQVLEQYPDIKILMLTNLDDVKTIKRVIESGLHGFLTKNVHPRDLESAIHSVYADGYYFEHKFAELVTRIFENDELSDASTPFSAREQEVLELAFQGYTAKEIAERLCISFKTVEKHKSNLISKTGAKTFIGVISFSLKHHILTVDSLRGGKD